MNIGQKTFQTEQELWHAFLSSDKNAFAYLFEKYADAMYAYGRKMTPDAELVKDAIQDVFVKLYNNRQNLRETVSVKGYLFIALKRTLLNLSQAHSILCLEEMDEVRFEIELISRNAFEEEASCYDEEMEQQLPPGISESGEVVDMAAYEAWQQENHPDTQQQMQRREEVNINVHRERGEDVEPGDDF